MPADAQEFTRDARRLLEFARAMNWDDLRVFLAVARHGTLAAAARSMGVNHATVSRRLAAFEKGLGRPLFDRDASGLHLTAAGQAVLAQAQAMDEAALAVRRLADAGAETGGAVRLTTARAMANGYLAARLAGLLDRHPGLEVTLLADTRILSLAQREADIAVRLGRPGDTELVGAHLTDIGYGFYAAPAVRAALEAGGALRLIGFDKDGTAAEGAWLAQHFPEATVCFRSNNQLSQRAVAMSGGGVALLPHYLAHGSGLQALPLGATPPPREVWLMTRLDLARLPRFRVVMDYLKALYHADRAIFTDPPA